MARSRAEPGATGRRAQLDRRAPERDRALRPAATVRGRSGAGGDRGAIDRRVVGEVGEPEHLLEVTELLGRSEQRGGLVGGARRGTRRRGQVPGLPRVLGEPGRRAEVGRLAQHLEVGPVQREALAGQQLGVDDLGQQGVAELDGVVALGEHLGRDRLADQLVERLGPPDAGPDRPQQWLAHAPAGDRRDPGQSLDLGVQPLQAGVQHLRERPRQLARGCGLEQLLREVGVALRARHHRAQPVLGDRAAPDRGGEPAQLVGREGRQLEALHARVAPQLTEQRAQRVAAVQVIGAVGGHHEHVLAAEPAGQEAQHVAGRRVRPVHVLDHQQQRVLRRARGRQSRDDPVEQLQATGIVARRRGGRSCARQQARKRRARCDHGVHRGGASGERTQRLGERQVRQPDLAQVHAVHGDGGCPVASGDLGDVAEEPGLAHAGVGPEQHETRYAAPRLGQVGQDLGHLVLAGHEVGGHAAGHASDPGSDLRRAPPPASARSGVGAGGASSACEAGSGVAGRVLPGSAGRARRGAFRRCGQARRARSWR